jgi:hypothetical protein
VLGQAVACVARTVWLLCTRRLHLRSDRVGRRVRLPDGREYEVFRESTCDQSHHDGAACLMVWFRLRSIPPGARIRRRLFERLCIVNTVLFAGFDGYLVKLWMVNPETSDYAGLYAWSNAAEAESYARYITAVLRPLSVRGSVGSQVVEGSALDDYVLHV